MSLDFRSMLHSPAESSTAYATYYENLTKFPGIKWGISSLDKHMIPLRPGDVMGIIARPGHGKSTLSAYLARKTARDILARQSKTECVVYVTFEQSIEEIEAFFQIDEAQYSVTDFAMGKVDKNVVLRGAIKRMNLPVWLVGKSMMKRGRIPTMTVSNVYRAIQTLEEDNGIKPTLIIIDYIQIVPVEKQSEKVQQVGEAIDRAKTELAMNCGCPVILCVQASRAVDKSKSKIPTAADCQWSSAIEQASDKLFGIWRPILTEKTELNAEKVKVRVNGNQIDVTSNLLIVKLLKQRFAAAGQIFPLHFAPEYVRLADIELVDQHV